MLKTKDLALATTLRVHGHEPLRMELNDDQARPSGSSTVPAKTVASSTTTAARWSSRAYNVTLRKTRDELFRFLNRNGINPRARRR
jgi:hypothetical protein